MLLSTPPLKDTSDKELVFLLVAGDEQAFYALYARYWTRLKGFCRQFLKSEDLAENYAQDIFLKIWETRELLDPERSFSAYLYTIARNTVFNYLRHVAVSENASRKLIRDYRRAEEADGDDEIIERDYLDLLHRAIERLTPRQQQVFRLSRDNNLSHREIAENLGISVYTVQEYISDSIHSIKKYIEKRSDIVFVLLITLSVFLS